MEKSEIAQPDFVDPNVVKTPEDIRKANSILTVTQTLRKIYSNRMVVEEVNAAIASGYYADETVLLKDLLEPATSPIYQMDSFKSRKVARGFKPGLFKEQFEKELGVSSMTARTNDEYFIDNGISIYFPYSEETEYTHYVITVVGATVESDQAWVYMPIGPEPDIINQPGTNVLVDDNYASLYPMHVVGVGAEPNPIVNSSHNPQNMLVRIGSVRCKYQFDRLISFTGNGGGSEIVFGRGDGYLQLNANQQVTSFNGDQFTIRFKRREIRNTEWKYVNEIWDANWEVDNPEQILGIYEQDTQGTKTFNGSVQTKISNNTTVTIGYAISVLTQDEIIRNWAIPRSFLVAQTQVNQGFGFINGTAVFGGSLDVSYTLPIQYY